MADRTLNLNIDASTPAEKKLVAMLKTVSAAFGEAGQESKAYADTTDRAMGQAVQSAESASYEMERALGALGVKSSARQQGELEKVVMLYKRVRESGVASQEDIDRATKAATLQLARLQGEAAKVDRAFDGLDASKELSRGQAAAGKLKRSLAGLAQISRGFGASFGGALTGLAGAYSLQQAMSKTLTTIGDGEKKFFQLANSVEAANMEFASTGGLDSWRSTVKSLSGEMKVFSEAEIAGAAARTVDMTKRLGLSEEQMVEVLKASADLSAGMTSLEGGVERVTAALRGEAEASEYLGLTLNETYVRSWYEARGATQGAWKDLTDMQKAQVRYNVLLEQTASKQGRAADYAKTAGGAWQYMTAQVSNAITTNDDLGKTLQDVGQYVADNADEIGKAASYIIELVAWLAKLAIENKELVAGFVGAGGLIVVLGVLSTALGGVYNFAMGLVGAFKVLRAVNVGASLLSMSSAAGGLVSSLGGVTGAISLGMLPVLAALVGVAGWAVKTFFDWRSEMSALDESLRANEVAQDRAAKSLVKVTKGLDAEGVTRKTLNELRRAGLVVWDEEAKRWAWASKEAEAAARKYGLVRNELEDLDKAVDAAKGDTAVNVDAKLDYSQMDADLAELRRKKSEHFVKLGLDPGNVPAELARLDATKTDSDHKITDNVPQVWDRLHKLDGSRTSGKHIMDVVTREGHAAGGLAGVARFAAGGHARRRGLLPGHGGGDSVRALLEPGEYITDRRTVRFFGPRFFRMLKTVARGGRLDQLAAVRQALGGLRFAEGGLVPGGSGAPAATYEVNLSLSGGTARSVRVAGERSRDNLFGLLEDLERAGMVRNG